MPLNLFDTVRLTEAIPLIDGGIAEVGTVGAIVEVFNEGEAYLVELFGGAGSSMTSRRTLWQLCPKLGALLENPLG